MKRYWSFEEGMLPVWDTDTVYGESLTMLRDETGAARAPLLYTPRQVLYVTNAAGTEEYTEGVDWYVEDGKFCLTETSRCFAFTEAELYPAEPIEGKSFAKPGGNILFGEGNFFHMRQLAVTYIPERCDWPGVRPACAREQLPRTWAALSEKRPLHVVLYGDSISWGGNASLRANTPPYQAPYGELFVEWLNRRWGAPVRLTNNAVGGMDAAWGIDHVDLMVNDYRPDLVLLAFGMNDGWKSVEMFEEQIRTIVTAIRAANPNAEIVLVATSTPNPILTDEKAPFWGNQYRFKPALDAIAADPVYGGGIAVADITGMQAALHSRKRFIDTTGNHVNHPNDFFHRLYAQYLCGMLTPEV